MSQLLGQVQHVLDIARLKRDSIVSDGQLVSRYLESRDQEAFALLVKRHGPMVWGVCSRHLRCPHDAADAFQATFLVLARRAEVISPPEKVGAWLFGVARQTAIRCRAQIAQKHSREIPLTASQDPCQPSEMAQRQNEFDDLKKVLDQALSALPAKYRLPVMMCDLEEKTHRDVARQLGWPIGTVSGRLVRGRQLLARRLARHGVALPTGALLAVAAEGAIMPSWLLKTTAQAASLSAATPVTAVVNGLATGVITNMFLTKCKLATGIVMTLTLSVIVVGTSGWAQAFVSIPSQTGAKHDSHQDHKVELKIDIKDTPLRALQREKVSLLTKAMNDIHKLRAEGKASYMDAAKSHHDVCKAEFDLANNDEDRMKAISKQVKWAKEIEVNAKKLNEEGMFPKLELYKVITDRIDAEIALERLKASVHGEHK